MEITELVSVAKFIVIMAAVGFAASWAGQLDSQDRGYKRFTIIMFLGLSFIGLSLL